MFKKIYYINLEHRTDRKEHVEKEISKIGFKGPVERINAAFGKNMDNQYVPKNLFTNEAIEATKRKTDITNTQTMTKGGMGVAMSQRWVYEKVLTGAEDYALILEDDITIPDGFMKKIEDTIKKIKYYDILWLGYHVKDNLSVGKEFDIPEKIWGLFGYIINKKAAKRMIEMYPITLQLDTEIPKVFPDLVVLALKEDARLVLSPLSEEATQFGSDIQFDREGFYNTNSDEMYGIIAIIMLVIIGSVWYFKEKIVKN
jgi:GR25 family glycosyltransferase involved in LPS biosynthesis